MQQSLGHEDTGNTKQEAHQMLETPQGEEGIGAVPAAAQRIKERPRAISKQNALQLQRTLGNQAVMRLIAVQRSTGHICDASCNHVARKLAENPAPIVANSIQRDDLDDKLEQYNELQPDLDAYTKRASGKSKTDFASGKLDPKSRAYAFSLPRDDQGKLTPEAIKILTEKEASDAKTMITDKYDTYGVKDKRSGLFKDRRLKSKMEGDKNTLTDKTRHPDLANVLESNKQANTVITATLDVGGVAMPVTYNKSDVNFAKRLALLANGVEKVKAKGFTVPVLNVQIPKYSRDVTINSDCSITVNSTASAAQYAAPNLMHLGSTGLNNPQEGTRGKPGSTTGETELNFTSAQVDLTGLGTVVHELGHALHFSLSPDKFLELSLTSFKGNGSTIANKVSGYAANTREFVAEVFTGLIYDKTYDADVIQMYQSLGGPLSGALRTQVGL